MALSLPFNAGEQRLMGKDDAECEEEKDGKREIETSDCFAWGLQNPESSYLLHLHSQPVWFEIFVFSWMPY